MEIYTGIYVGKQIKTIDYYQENKETNNDFKV